MKRAPLLLFAVLLTGCATFPELEGTVPAHMERADFPRLVPVEPLMAGATDTQVSPETEAAILARVAQLRARAARLKGTVVDQGARARMRAGVTGIVEH
ncbi:hypothetical protein [Marimonas arenosa]|uniref:Uncharacterized protein n=1 Tax=Marimonas arenosa TaxID=1795305 RepID=A0AAE4B4K2_9RHOB|nr:hypothetical protein [Marimonas arenosa]MDQ2089464.1 hypothetical protein [Marimonas arenosa]